MTETKPYFLTVRQFVDGDYEEGGRAGYIKHPSYSRRPANYIRSYLLLQKDLLDLFEYIEPAEANLSTYSLRIHGLLVRTCIELEANFKSIFALNKYQKSPDDLNMRDYYKADASHYLSQYAVKAHYWTGSEATEIRRPFLPWSAPKNPSPPWVLPFYQGYNATKHDRATALDSANLVNLLDAFCALVVLITSQYLFQDFGPGHDNLVVDGPGDGFEPAIGNYFKVMLPQNIPDAERYDFDWQKVAGDQSPFQSFDYDAI